MEDRSHTRHPGGLRRRSVGVDASSPNLPLNLQVGFTVDEGSVIKGTPSPSTVKIFTDNDNRPSSSLIEFRKKQQSFEIHIEDCDEEELSGGSSDEGGPGSPMRSRPLTPAQLFQFPDYSGNTVHKEQQTQENFLTLNQREQDGLTDVSEGESDNEEDTEDDPDIQSVIKRVPA